MSKTGMQEKVKQFIFEHIDSVEQLDVLLLFRHQKDKEWTPETIANEMRSSAKSVHNRILSLQKIGLIQSVHDFNFKYREGSDETEAMLDDLDEMYRIKKQKILELIFSPLKKGRHFADAFMVTKSKEEDDG